jgi:hypothetical protein
VTLNFKELVKPLVNHHFFCLITLDYIWVLSHLSFAFVHLLISPQ